ncbi:MAG: type II secretion system protein [Verrucomicrobiota bacterium]|nr:type II secretion system protein [Verrucomicrobiota bacterium]
MFPAPAFNTRLLSGASSARCHRAGFTLVEVLVTLVIVSFGLVAVLAAFQKSISAVDQARDVLRAATLVARRIAEIEAAAVEGSVAPSPGTGRFVEPYGQFLWEQQVKEDAVELAEPRVGAGRRRWYEVQISVWREGRQLKRHTAGTVIGMPEEPAPR